MAVQLQELSRSSRILNAAAAVRFHATGDCRRLVWIRSGVLSPGDTDGKNHAPLSDYRGHRCSGRAFTCAAAAEINACSRTRAPPFIRHEINAATVATISSLRPLAVEAAFRVQTARRATCGAEQFSGWLNFSDLCHIVAVTTSAAGCRGTRCAVHCKGRAGMM